MLQQFAGVPLEQHLQDFHKYADDFQKLPIYYLAFHGQQPLKVVMEVWRPVILGFWDAWIVYKYVITS